MLYVDCFHTAPTNKMAIGSGWRQVEHGAGGRSVTMFTHCMKKFIATDLLKSEMVTIVAFASRHRLSFSTQH